MLIPRDYQEAAITATLHELQYNVGNPIVAMPTATGKSLVIAEIIRRMFAVYSQTRLLVLTHVKELIDQDYRKLIGQWPSAPAGIFSAGLGEKNSISPIIFGGVKSVANRIRAESGTFVSYNNHFGFRDVVLIDECHIVSPDSKTEYMFVINELRRINPKLRVIGFTATAYRTKEGDLSKQNGIFSHICFDITDMNSINRLIREGYMSMIVTRPTNTEFDLQGLKLSGDDFNQKALAERMDIHELTVAAIKESLEWAAGRKCWMAFGTSTDHVEDICDILNSYNVNSSFVHSKLSKKVNDDRIEAYIAGELDCLVNQNKLTTGFDHPPIDLILDLQPTNSTVKHVQKYGRGARPYKHKPNCLGLDYGGNVARLGPINDPVIPEGPKGRGRGESIAPVKTCKDSYEVIDNKSVLKVKGCGFNVHASLRFCPFCNREFDMFVNLAVKAGTNEIIRLADGAKLEPIKTEWVSVDYVSYQIHEKKNPNGIRLSPPSVKVCYFRGTKAVFDWLFFVGRGMALTKAKKWWSARTSIPCPATSHEAVRLSTGLLKPKRILVKMNDKYPEVIDYEF